MLLAIPGIAPAAMMSYGLNLNNIGLPTNIDYATVTIRDDAEAGVGTDAIQFEIATNTGFFDEGPNYGIQAFYFNSSLNFTGLSPTVSLLPPGPDWSFNFDFGDGITPEVPGFQASEFGKFNVEYKGTGQVRRDPLKFELNVAGDDISTYALNNLDGFAFALHIADFTNFTGLPSLTAPPESGWFSASLTPNPIPVPAAFWLFGTALIGFIGISRRTKV